MAFDLDEDELKATRKMNKADRNEIEVGEYGRTNKGKIFIFAWLENLDGKRYANKVLLGNGKIFENKFYYFDDGEEIVKHSKHLIEDKDIVEIELSEEFVEKKDKKKFIQIGDIYTKETLQKDIDNGIITRILTILSYNQYIANCYKVGGEDE